MSSIPNFKEDVESLVHAFSDIENPFLENSCDLISLETSQIMPTDVVESVMTAKESGRKQCETFFFFRENYNKTSCMVFSSSSQ